MIYCHNCHKSKLSVKVEHKGNGVNYCESCWEKANKKSKSSLLKKKASTNYGLSTYQDMIFDSQEQEIDFIVGRQSFLSNQERLLTLRESQEFEIMRNRMIFFENEMNRPTPVQTPDIRGQTGNTDWAGMIQDEESNRADMRRQMQTGNTGMLSVNTIRAPAGAFAVAQPPTEPIGFDEMMDEED